MASKQNKGVKSSHNTIPQDLCFTEILSRLPAKSLIRFKSVSKQWNSLISSPDFANLQLELSKQTNLIIQGRHGVCSDPVTIFNLKFTLGNFELSPLIKHPNSKIAQAYHEKVYLIGSCHGLICYYDRPRFFVANPTVEKLCSIQLDPCLDLKPALNVSCNDLLIQLAGFGYDSSTRDYKIVFISRLNDCCGYLFSLNNSSWKKLDTSWYTESFANYYYDWLSLGMPRGFVYPIQVNNTLHWLITRHSLNFTVLLTFDLAEEVFSVIDLPSTDDNTIGITQIRRCLCKVHYQSGTRKNCRRKNPRLEVQMLEKYGVWDSWQTFYVCDLGMTLSKDYLNFFEFRDTNNDDRMFILKNIITYSYSNENSLRVHFTDSDRLHQYSEVALQGYQGNKLNFWLRCAFSFTESLIWPSYFSSIS